MWWKRGKKCSPLSSLQLLFILLHINHNHHLDLTPFACWQVIAVHLLSKDAVASIIIWTSSARIQVQKIPNNYLFRKPTPIFHQNLEVEKKRDETIFCLLCSFVFSCVLIQPAGAEHRAHCTFIRGGQLPVFQKASAENNAWAISLQQGPLVMKTAVKLAPRPCGRGKSFPCAEWKDHVAVMHSQAGPPYFPKQTTKEHL